MFNNWTENSDVVLKLTASAGRSDLGTLRLRWNWCDCFQRWAAPEHWDPWNCLLPTDSSDSSSHHCHTNTSVNTSRSFITSTPSDRKWCHSQLGQLLAELPRVGFNATDAVVWEMQLLKRTKTVEPSFIDLRQVIILQLPAHTTQHTSRTHLFSFTDLVLIVEFYSQNFHVTETPESSVHESSDAVLLDLQREQTVKPLKRQTFHAPHTVPAQLSEDGSQWQRLITLMCPQIRRLRWWDDVWTYRCWRWGSWKILAGMEFRRFLLSCNTSSDPDTLLKQPCSRREIRLLLRNLHTHTQLN